MWQTHSPRADVTRGGLTADTLRLLDDDLFAGGAVEHLVVGDRRYRVQSAAWGADGSARVPLRPEVRVQLRLTLTREQARDVALVAALRGAPDARPSCYLAHPRRPVPLRLLSVGQPVVASRADGCEIFVDVEALIDWAAPGPVAWAPDARAAEQAQRTAAARPDPRAAEAIAAELGVAPASSARPGAVRYAVSAPRGCPADVLAQLWQLAWLLGWEQAPLRSADVLLAVPTGPDGEVGQALDADVAAAVLRCDATAAALRVGAQPSRDRTATRIKEAKAAGRRVVLCPLYACDGQGLALRAPLLARAAESGLVSGPLRDRPSVGPTALAGAPRHAVREADDEFWHSVAAAAVVADAAQAAPELGERERRLAAQLRAARPDGREEASFRVVCPVDAWPLLCSVHATLRGLGLRPKFGHAAADVVAVVASPRLLTPPERERAAALQALAPLLPKAGKVRPLVVGVAYDFADVARVLAEARTAAVAAEVAARCAEPARGAQPLPSAYVDFLIGLPLLVGDALPGLDPSRAAGPDALRATCPESLERAILARAAPASQRELDAARAAAPQPALAGAALTPANFEAAAAVLRGERVRIPAGPAAEAPLTAADIGRHCYLRDARMTQLAGRIAAVDAPPPGGSGGRWVRVVVDGPFAPLTLLARDRGARGADGTIFVESE